ncbi:tyrosine-type recombinase/integrase [Flagellimonas hymeniacidonis]|uniref:Tyrosine-type recombinase/integrase n=1 Tax=Flagellimonas hymeniacidonis TaxID=2603628 RepID=A0A5C8V561_9FLAO|nr:tyrosine-type recombinase/integrase [Flagellimonas hymeniacidonis]TXN36901.1 tyrosine-type recombinase/integrase [Flagellimonas hymeniacidonis]
MDIIKKRLGEKHVNEYVNIISKFAIKMYSEPRLYIPKEVNKDGSLGTPSLKKRWYVYYYFRDPSTGQMSKQPFKVYKGLNRLKTVSQRKAAGKMLVNVTKRLLSENYNPYDLNSASKNAKDIISVRMAFEGALENKRNYLKPNTFDSYEDYLNMFLHWCDKKGLSKISITKLEEEHVISYFNYLGRKKPTGKGLMPTSVHNHKLNLSAIMSSMQKSKLIGHNFIKDIETKKNKPLKNAPFTLEEIGRIKKVLANQNPPFLYNFIQFLFYSFMRNREILSTKVRNVNMVSKTISIETKGDRVSHILMVEPLYQLLKQWNIEQCPGHFDLFTPKGVPGIWDVSIKQKVDSISKNFAKIREELNIDAHKKTYSFRHNAAVDLFKSFVEQGFTENEAIQQLMKITRHKDESALRNYLRDIGAILPKDWTKHYNISF